MRSAVTKFARSFKLRHLVVIAPIVVIVLVVSIYSLGIHGTKNDDKPVSKRGNSENDTKSNPKSSLTAVLGEDSQDSVVTDKPKNKENSSPTTSSTGNKKTSQINAGNNTDTERDPLPTGSNSNPGPDNVGETPAPNLPNSSNYPWANVPMNTYVDPWGYYGRSSESYAAWMVSSTGRTAPAFYGSAKNWPSSAASRGITVDSTPRIGDVAISTAGSVGHAMYVESIQDSSFVTSEYNTYLNGSLSRQTRASGGYYFIHF